MKHRLSIIIVVALVLLLADTAAFAADNWPTFHQNNQRTGLAVKDASGTGVLGNFRPKPIWTFPAPEQSMLVVDNAGPDKDNQHFRTGGSWSDNPLNAVAPYGQNSPLYVFTESDKDGKNYADWEFDFAKQADRDFTLKGGSASFYVYVWVPSPGQSETPEHISDAEYTVYINGTIAGTYELDQRQGGNWQLLTWQSFGVKNDDKLVVRLTSKTKRVGEEIDDKGQYLPLKQTVIADAVMLRLDAGWVVSSPVVSQQHPVVVTTKVENTLSWTSSDYYGSLATGAVYGLGTDLNSGAGTADDRGRMVWRYPAADHNLVCGGIGSSAALFAPTGTEYAAVAAGDGQVYVVNTGKTSGQVADLVWRGPGYYIDDVMSEGTLTLSGGFAPQAVFGRQGDTAGIASAVAKGEPNVAKAKWVISIPPFAKDRSFDAYAWIPPAQGNDLFISDATYNQLDQSGNVVPNTSTTVDQSWGGYWVEIGRNIRVPTSNANTFVGFQLTNETSYDTKNAYVAADAVKLVPSTLGEYAAFDMSSPVIDNAGFMYVSSMAWDWESPKGRVFKLSLDSKDPVWCFPSENEQPVGSFEAAPALSPDGSTVYVGSSDGRLYAINSQTGALKWKYPDPASPTPALGQISSATPVMAAGGKTVVFIATGGWYGNPNATGIEGKIYAIEDLGDKPNTLWVHPGGTDALGIFAYSTGLLIPKQWGDTFPKLVIGSSDGNLYTLKSEGNGDGTTVLEQTAKLGVTISDSPAGTYVGYPKRGDKTNTPRTNVPMAFVGTGSRIYGVDLTDGTQDWWWDLMGPTTSSPTITNNRIYTGDTEGYTWAFSTGLPGGGGVEDWNGTLGELPKPGSEPTAAGGKEAHPEVDIFTKSDWETNIRPKLEDAEHNGNLSLSSDELHKYAIDGSLSSANSKVGVRPNSAKYTLEWGEDFYIVVWNLIDPNKKDLDKPSTWVKDGPDADGKWTMKVNDNYPGKVIITIKNNETGKAGETMGTITLAGHGQIDYFNDAKEYTDEDGNKVKGFACFWTATLYQIGASSQSNNPSTPGTQFVITASEQPAPPNSSSLETPVPNDPDACKVGDPADKPESRTPVAFSINNPIGIKYDGPYGQMSAESSEIGVTAGSTRRGDATAQGNGNCGKAPPIIWEGYAPHNKLSDTRPVIFYDRSLLSTTGRRINNFRVQRQDLQWTGGPSQIINKLPWEDLPLYVPGDFNQGIINSSDVYPDIDLRQIRCRSVMNGRDPSQGGITLTPSKQAAVPGMGEPWQLNANVVNFAVQIPQFQPANMPMDKSTNPPTPANPSLANRQQLGESGYTSLIYAYVDSNNNGVCDGVGRLGISAITQQKLTGSISAEPYRVLEVKVHVPADYRAEIEDPRVNIGEVPQGFGFTDDGTTPRVFWRPLDTTIPKVAPLGFAEWFQPLSIRNTGNVNLTDVALIRNNMFSDTVQQPMLDQAGNFIPYSGSWIPGSLSDQSCLVSTLDAFEARGGTWLTNVPSLATGYGRTFHKANVKDTEGPLLKIPDCPNWLATPNVQDFPRVSVAMPIGTPVGTYYGKMQLGQYDGLSKRYAGVSNTVDVIATCTESRMTDGSTLPSGVGQPHLAQLDQSPPAITDPPTVLDTMPAAYRDPATGSLVLFWSSSRYGPDTTNGPNTADPWYLYQSKLRLNPNTGDWDLQNGPSSTKQWWVPTDTTTTRFPDPTTVATFFPSTPPDGAPGNVIPGTVRFGSPSVAVDKINGKSYLLFTGQAYKDAGVVATKPGSSDLRRRDLECRAYYTEIKNDAVNPANIRSTSPNATSGLPISGDWTTPKFGIRGAVMQRTPAAIPELWGFWYGGGNGKWRLYYNVKRDPSDLSAQWSNEALLPFPRGLSSVAEPSPVVQILDGATGPEFGIVYSGISNYHKNSDIYLSWYRSFDPASDPTCIPGNPAANPEHIKVAKEGGWPVELKVLAQRGKEIPAIAESYVNSEPIPLFAEKMTRDGSQTTWYSRDVDWVSDVVTTKDADLSANKPTSFDVYVLFNADPKQPVNFTNLNNISVDRIYQINVGSAIKDSNTGAIAYTFSGGNALENALKKYFRAVVINPVEGTAKFMRLPKTNLAGTAPIKNMLVVAKYFPRAYRLTTDGVADASPCAVMDDDPNPRFGLQTNDPEGLPFFIPPAIGGGSSSNILPPPTDRLWVFWRRPAMDRPGTGIYYKAHRYMVQLDAQLALKVDKKNTGSKDVDVYLPAINGINVPPGGTPVSQPVEVDWVKSRLYFASIDGIDMQSFGTGIAPFAKKVLVTYLDANGQTHTNEPHYIQFADEDMGQPGKTFGNLTSLMVNEGQVTAFKDPGYMDSNGVRIPENKLWVFWSSTRSGNSDLYYETISPRFVGREFK